MFALVGQPNFYLCDRAWKSGSEVNYFRTHFNYFAGLWVQLIVSSSAPTFLILFSAHALALGQVLDLLGTVGVRLAFSCRLRPAVGQSFEREIE